LPGLICKSFCGRIGVVTALNREKFVSSIRCAGSITGHAKAEERPTMTVFVYVDTNKQVGDPDRIEVFASQLPRRPGFSKMIRTAWRASMRFWNEATTVRRRARNTLSRRRSSQLVP
jgi:hypothetical protein